MAGIESGTGTAGSSFTHYNYPGIYQTQVRCDDSYLRGLLIVLLHRTSITVACSLATILSTTATGQKCRRASSSTSQSTIFCPQIVLVLTEWYSLATDTDYVRGKLAAYGNDLLSLGAVGFRLDAAKRVLQLPLSCIHHA